MQTTPWTGAVTRYDCGCSIDQDKVGACSIAYCPAHDAAPELLEALLHFDRSCRIALEPSPDCRCVGCVARAVIAKAGG